MRIALVFSAALVALSCARRVPPPPAAPPPAPHPKPVLAALVPGARVAPPLPQESKPWNFPSGAKVDVQLRAGTDLAQVTPRHFGNNLAWYDGKAWLTSPDVIAKAAKSGVHFWRWPGGSSADNYHWDGKYGTHTKDHDGRETAKMRDPWAASSDDLIEFCRATQSEAIVTVNYGLARYGSVQKAADLAARWVRYFNVEKGFKVRYWEIGNEVYGPWEEGNKLPGKPPMSGEVYARDFNVIAQAMRAVDSEVRIGAVAVDADTGDDWVGYRWWMRDMLPILGESADFLVAHNYFHWPFEGGKFVSPANDKLFANIGKVAKAKADIDSMVQKYAHRATPMPVMLTEFNVVNASAPQTIQLISGLFVAEVLGESIKAGYLGAHLWDWKNGLDPKLGGDHGMLASGDSAVPESTPRPSFFAYALYERAFGHRMIDASSSEPRLKVYASRFAGGQVGLVVVNEQSEPVTVNVDLSGLGLNGTAVAWVLDADDLNAKQVRWNGVAGPEGGGGPFPIDGLPPYVANFEGSAGAKLNLPANCATGIVLY
ncbi:MAG TPA: hypothetical protein VK540_00755 [Polyangiaceae bacterium]|nr:hypothetical protein [Polyangiaceae bacterium]